MRILSSLKRAMPVVVVAMMVWGGALAEEGGRVSLPTLIHGKGDHCVEPTPLMRRSHMDMLLHQRDRTMHLGIRTRQHSLKECINCHVRPLADGSYPPITSKQHFCNSCHAYAGVSLDCFECHATKPEPDAEPKSFGSAAPTEPAPSAVVTAAERKLTAAKNPEVNPHD